MKFFYVIVNYIKRPAYFFHSTTTDAGHNRSTSSQLPETTCISPLSSSFYVSSLETSDDNGSELCSSFTHEPQHHLRKSRYIKSSLCTQCAEDTFGKSCVSYWGRPTYQRGSWKRRYRAERSTDIDLTPLLDVLKRIDQIDTSMGIPLEAYTKHLPDQTREKYVNSCHKEEKTMFVTNCIKNNKSSESTEVKSWLEISAENSSDCQTVFIENQQISNNNVMTKTVCKDPGEIEFDEDVQSMNRHKVAGNHFERGDMVVSADSDSEFENIFKDALQYNKSLQKKNTQNAYINNRVNKNSFKTKSESLPKSSARYMNTQDHKPWMEYNLHDETLQSENKGAANEQKTRRGLNVNCKRTKTVPSSMEKGQEKEKRKNKVFSSNEFERESAGGADKPLTSSRKRRSELKRSDDTERRQNYQRQISEETESKNYIYTVNSPINVVQKSYSNETIDIEDDRIITNGNPQNIDKVPDSYEAFNNSLERGTVDGSIKTSSLGSVPCVTVVKPPQDLQEKLPTKPDDIRRNTVSQLTAFWKQQLLSGPGNASECSDQESDDNENQSIGTCPDNLKIQSVTNIREKLPTSEIGTDEDENFRNIQSKLDNLTKQSMKYNMRRKSILKNKDVTSSFLNEFLTVPAARIRNPGSESGDSVCSGMKPEQFVKRRVSFQSTALLSSLSNSSRDEKIHRDEEFDLRDIQSNDYVTKHYMNSNAQKSEPTEEVFPRRPSIHITDIDSEEIEVVDLDDKIYIGKRCVYDKSAEENTENEHILWRTEDAKLAKSSTNAQDMFYSNGKEPTCQKRLLKPQIMFRNSSSATREIVTDECLCKTTGMQDKNLVLACEDHTSNKKTESSKIGNAGFLNATDDRDVSCRIAEDPDDSKESLSGVHRQVSSNMFDKTPATEPESSKSTLKTNGNDISTNIVDDAIDNSRMTHVCDNQNKESSRDAYGDKGMDKYARKRRPRAKLFSIADEDSPDEYSKLLDNPVELNSSDSSDIELSWRTRGYSDDFYVSRKSTTGSEIINKFRQVIMRKKSRERKMTRRKKPADHQTTVKVQSIMGACV